MWTDKVCYYCLQHLHRWKKVNNYFWKYINKELDICQWTMTQPEVIKI